MKTDIYKESSETGVQDKVDIVYVSRSQTDTQNQNQLMEGPSPR